MPALNYKRIPSQDTQGNNVPTFKELPVSQHIPQGCSSLWLGLVSYTQGQVSLTVEEGWDCGSLSGAGNEQRERCEEWAQGGRGREHSQQAWRTGRSVGVRKKSSQRWEEEVGEGAAGGDEGSWLREAGLASTPHSWLSPAYCTWPTSSTDRKLKVCEQGCSLERCCRHPRAAWLLPHQTQTTWLVECSGCCLAAGVFSPGPSHIQGIPRS